MRRQWLQGLVEAGINSQIQLDSGLAMCRQHQSPFLPSIGQFIGWCKAAVEVSESLPSEVDARIAMNHELAKPIDARDWTKYHPAVFWAYSQHGSFDWKQMKTKDQRDAFAEVWRTVRKMVQTGFDFHAALPKKKTADEDSLPKASRETANKIYGDIMETFGAKK